MKFLLWLILLVLCWPLALLALVLWPLVWLICLPFRLIGIAVDITEQKSLAEKTVEADLRLRDAIETIPEAFVLWDADDRLVLCNSHFQRLHKLPDTAVAPGTSYETVIEVGSMPEVRTRQPDTGTVAPGARTFEAQLDPFLKYARLAAAGERFMYISHSSIDPPDFASTTECAHYLIQRLGGRPEAVERRDRFGLELVELFSRGQLHIRGYAGNDKPDHCAQLALLRDVYRTLGTRWSRP